MHNPMIPNEPWDMIGRPRTWYLLASHETVITTMTAKQGGKADKTNDSSRE